MILQMSKDFKIYTKTGDDGTTGLVGGSRVRKSNFRLEAYGTVDELNSWIGLIRSVTGNTEVVQILLGVQNKLFVIGSKLASDEKGKKITDPLACCADDIALLEKSIDRFEEELVPLQHFILPGGSALVSYCHIARTVCRRAERRIVQLSEIEPVSEEVVKYVNRLSDFLFVLGRKMAQEENVAETPWKHD